MPIIPQKNLDPEYDPILYRKKLLEIAHENGIRVIEEPPKGYVSFQYSTDDDTIRTAFAPDQPFRSAHGLEHELVHALQYRKYPRMTISEQEFEALIIGRSYHLDDKGNKDFLLDKDRFKTYSANVLNGLISDFEETHPMKKQT